MISTKNIISLNFQTKGIKNVKKQIESVSSAMRANQNRFKELRTNYTGANEISQKLGVNSGELAMSMKAQGYDTKTAATEMRGWNRNTQEGSTRVGRMALGLRRATHGMRGFRMEMLGVMFFGMSLQRTFFGLFKTSLDWLGVTEIMSAAMGILFLPVAEQILDWAIAFLGWVSQLTKEEKKLYGTIALLVGGLGALLFVFGTLALGIGSLILAFGWLFSTTGLIIGILAVLGGWLLYNSEYFDKLSLTADNTKDKLTEMGVPAEIFTELGNSIGMAHTKLKEFLSEKAPSIFGNLSSDTDELSNSEYWGTAAGNMIRGLGSAISTYLEENPLMVLGGIIGLFAGGPFGAMLGSAIGKGVQAIDWERIDPLIEAGIEMATKILDGLVEEKEKIGEAIEKVLDAMLKWIGENADKLEEVGWAIAKGVLKGFVSGMGEFRESIGGMIKGGINKKTGISEGGLADNLLWGPKGNVEEGGDFIIQPNGRLIKTDPQDTIMGRKGGFGDSGINVNATYNVTVSDKREFENMLRDNNERMVSDVRRLVQT